MHISNLVKGYLMRYQSEKILLRSEIRSLMFTSKNYIEKKVTKIISGFFPNMVLSKVMAGPGIMFVLDTTEAY